MITSINFRVEIIGVRVGDNDGAIAHFFPTHKLDNQSWVD
jgi:hypothetical protein